MRILFSSCHNYLDVGSGAAVTTREELLELVRRGHKARTLCGALFDGVRSGEEELVKTLGRQGIPAQRSLTTVEVGGARLTFKLYRFDDSGIDSTVFIPLEESGRETNWRVEAEKTFLALLEEQFDKFSPDILVSYGGQRTVPASAMKAKRRGIKSVFMLHNLSYRDRKLFENFDMIVVPSEYVRKRYRDRLGFDARVVAPPIDPAKVVATERAPRFLTFVTPTVEKGLYFFLGIARELGERRPDIPILLVEGRGKVQRLATIPEARTTIFRAMKEYSFTFKCFSRRQFLKATCVCGGTSAGLGYWNALALSQETRPRRQEPNDGLSLAEYITREASEMDYFPCGILNDAPVRFRAALTFERYLKFYRYKKKVLSSTREEIDDCIRQIDDFSIKTKALVLAAVRLFSLTHSPGSGYEKAYRDWQEQLERIPDPVEIRRRLTPLVTDLDSVETRSYRWGKRSYYPYCYPVLWHSSSYRTILILGAPIPDSSVDKAWIQKNLLLLRKCGSSEEIAFPFPTVDDKETPTVDFVRTSQRLKESPLRFLAFTRPTISPTSRNYTSELPDDKRDPNLWFKWFKNIEECVAIIRRELDLKIPAERWISDYYPDADAFLQKVAKLENDKSVPFDKIELLIALREYWISMQIPFEYSLNPKKSPEKFISPHTGEYPFYDVLDNRSLSLQDVFLYFRPSSYLL